MVDCDQHKVNQDVIKVKVNYIHPLTLCNYENFIE